MRNNKYRAQLRKQKDEEWLQMILDCEKRIDRLDEWSQGFVKDVGQHVKAGGILTDTQDAKLKDLWEKATVEG